MWQSVYQICGRARFNFLISTYSSFNFCLFIVMYFNIIFLILSLIEFVNSACPPPPERSAEAKLREKLFCNYKKNLRPTENYANATNVLIALYPRRIYMNHWTDTLSVHGFFVYIWRDPNLSWNPSEYEGIDYLARGNEIWQPDIVIDSASTSMKLNKITNSYPLISNAGDVFVTSLVNVMTHCSADMTKFPYDTQNCSFSISSQGYLGKYVDLYLIDPRHGIAMMKYIPNRVWDVVDYSAKRLFRNFSLKGEDETDSYPYIKFNFVLQRRASKFQAILIVPCLALAAITLLTFLMHSMYYSRMILCCVSIIGYSLYITYFMFWFLSESSTTPIIVTFYRDSLLISILALLAAISVHHISSKTNEPQPWISKFMFKLESSPLGSIFLSDATTKEDDTVELVEDQKQNKVTDWSQFAFFINRVLLIVCILLYVILSICYIP